MPTQLLVTGAGRNRAEGRTTSLQRVALLKLQELQTVAKGANMGRTPAARRGHHSGQNVTVPTIHTIRTLPVLTTLPLYLYKISSKD